MTQLRGPFPLALHEVVESEKELKEEGLRVDSERGGEKRGVKSR